IHKINQTKNPPTHHKSALEALKSKETKITTRRTPNKKKKHEPKQNKRKQNSYLIKKLIITIKTAILVPGSSL
ncbi:hypothetical protein L9G16_19590, partial [Shewanella sp. A25]|nr:hypothetical protein [Shewanella shenzhenensis]